MAALNRKVQLIEEDLERSEERSGTALTKLHEASEAADEASRWVCSSLQGYWFCVAGSDAISEDPAASIGGSRIFFNVGTFLPDYTASHLTREQYSSSSP